MSIPFLPGTTDISEHAFDPQAMVTVGGRTKPLAWWHETARLAMQAGDAHALDAARQAIHKYADQLTQGYQIQRAREAGEANTPAPLAAAGSHAMDAASLGLAAPMRGAVTALEGKGFGAGEREVSDALANQEAKQPIASMLGTAAGGLALGAGTGAVAKMAPFGATLPQRLASMGRTAGLFGGEGAVRGATHATGGSILERAIAAGKEGATDAALGAAAEGTATGLRDRLLRPIKRDQLLQTRLEQAAERAHPPQSDITHGVFGQMGPKPVLEETEANLAERAAGVPEPRTGRDVWHPLGPNAQPTAKPISEGSPGSGMGQQTAPTTPAEAPSRPGAPPGGGGPAGYASRAKINPQGTAAVGTNPSMLEGVLRTQVRAGQLLKGPATRAAQQELLTLLSQSPPGSVRTLLQQASPAWQAILGGR